MTTFFKNIIFLFVLPLLLWSCGSELTSKSNEVTLKVKENPSIEIDSSKILLVHEKYDNGNTKFYGTVYDSLYHGYCKTFFLNETITSQGKYYLGQKEGWWEYFHENGHLKECGHYSLDLQTGTWRYYNHFGELTSEKNYSNGKLNGWCKSYINNLLIEECEYKQDKKQGYYHYYENGMLILKGNYFNNKKVGIWKTFNEKGKIVYEEDFG